MPQSLRRFQSIKISKTKVLLLGGISRLAKESDAVYCFDCDEASKPVYSVEVLDKIDKPGVIEMPILIDSVGAL